MSAPESFADSLETDAADKLFQRADALIELKRWRDAIPLLQQYLTHKPGSFTGVCLLAAALVNAGDAQQSLSVAERAAQLAPENEWAHRLRSIALLRLNRKKEALAAAEIAVRFAPADYNALETLINAQQALKKWTEAQQTAENLRALHPERENTFIALADICLETGKNAEAEVYLRQALAINALSFRAMNNLGVVLLRQKRRTEATECFQRAAKLSPQQSALAINNLKEAVAADSQKNTGWIMLLALPALFVVGPGAFALAALIRFFVNRSSYRETVAKLPAEFQTALDNKRSFKSRFRFALDARFRSNSLRVFFYFFVGVATIFVLLWLAGGTSQKKVFLEIAAFWLAVAAAVWALRRYLFDAREK